MGRPAAEAGIQTGVEGEGPLCTPLAASAQGPAAETIPPPSSVLLLPQGDLEYLSCIRWKKKWNRRELCYCIWNLPENFPLSSSWKIVLIWNMKLLSNLLAQRWEWKTMLLGLWVAPPELVGVYGQPGLSVESSPVHQNCKFIFSSLAASPTKICPKITGGEGEGEGGEPGGGSRAPGQTHTRLLLSWTHIHGSGLCPISFGSRVS